MKIELSDFEQKICVAAAKRRYKDSRAAGIHNAKVGPQSNYETDLSGIAGEFACAKAFNVYPDLTFYVRKGGVDLTLANGTRLDIKTTKYPSGKLLARKSCVDNDIDAFVLVTGEFPNYDIKGWATKEHLVSEESYRPMGKYGNSYWLGQDEINNNLEELMK